MTGSGSPPERPRLEPASRASSSADPVLPDRAAEDTDRAWGSTGSDADQPDADDERLLRDVPPHWA